MIDHHRHRILAMLRERPRHLKDFTDGEVTLQVSARHVERWIEEMLADGWVIRTRSREYRITEAGRAVLREEATVATPRDHFGAGTYTGERWAVRPGGEAHKRFRSLGIDGNASSSVSQEAS